MSEYDPNMWIMKITPGGTGNTKMYFENLFVKEGCKNLIGYTKEEGDIEKFRDRWNRIKIGDLIVVIEAHNRVFGVVEVTSQPFDEEPSEENSQSDWFYHRRKAALVKYFNPFFQSVADTNRDTIIEYSGDGAISICDEVWEKIKEDYLKNKKAEKMQRQIGILRYKKQIILQGPPGTGKTYTAKKIAEEMTKGKNIGSPKQKIDEYFNTNQIASDEVKKKRSEYAELLSEFQNKFKKEDLKYLSLEAYAFGRGDNDSFCYWLEYVLWDLGLYSGQAGKFKIYWKKSIQGYSKIGFLKDIEDDEEAMKLLAEQIYNVANEINLNEAAKKLSNGLVLKILHSYYPQKYFPINNEKCINNALKLLNVDGSSLDFISKNIKLQELFLNKRNEFGSDITNDEFMRFLFTNFDMQGNIEIQSNEVVLKGDSKIIQFHPAYSYEDFIRGITATANAENKIEYNVENRILVEFAQSAIENPSANYVLIIDEINRANLPAVLGELIYALEYRYDDADRKNTTVDSMYAIKLDDETESKEIKIPKNLYIIGTMNTADRSVGHIDYAIRRRFAFVDVLPREIPELTDNGKKLFQKVALLFCDKFEEGNSDLKNSKYLAQDFKPTDVILGHSYFLVKEEDRKTLGKTDDEILEMKLTYEILPLLREYVKDGILSKEAELQFKPTIAEWLKP